MNEVAKKEESGALTVSDRAGTQQAVLASDMVIPKLQLMQGLSDKVAERAKSPDGQVIQMGHMIRSTTGEILGDPDKPVDIIPLRFASLWMLGEKVGGDLEFRGYIPRDGGLEDAEREENAKTGENLPWEFKHLGADWKRTKVIRLFGLLPADILGFQAEVKAALANGDMPDLEKTLLPIVVDFRIKSYPAGKDVATYFLKIKELAQYGARPYGYSMPLSCVMEENDKGKFYVFKTGKTKKLDAALLEQSERWFNTLSNVATVKVDEQDTSEVGGAAPSGEAGVSGKSQF
jgi:hypothetical protein